MRRLYCSRVVIVTAVWGSVPATVFGSGVYNPKTWKDCGADNLPPGYNKRAQVEQIIRTWNAVTDGA
jgi:hypothetical protein